VAFDPHTRKQFLNSNPSLLTRLGIAVYTRVDRLGWRRYEKIFCISQEVAARVRNARLAPDDRVEIIYPGVDMEEFRPSFPIEPYFLLPGRIMWAKNIELGIDAFRALKTNVQAAERFRLVVAGIVDEKSRTYLNALKERAAGIPDVEFVIDPSGELYARLHQHAYAVLFTSLNEDWGLVPLEGMAAGRPVIAVAQGGPLESVLHGETGFLCPPEPKAFAYAMQDLIDDPARAETIGSAGRERAALFSWSNFVSRIDDYAESLIQGSIEPISQDTSTEQVGG
jgi:glycosyltransferase involved in cell wall biosynthesis